MLKLNAGFSRKVGEPNYGSRGASVNVELELESNLIDDPQALMGRIRNLFDLARRAVDDELGAGQPQAGNTVADNQSSQRPERFARNNSSTSGNGNQPVRYATTSQIRAIRAICNRQNVDPVQLANTRFRVNDLEELTLREASSLIDELKGTANNGRKAGAR